MTYYHDLISIVKAWIKHIAVAKTIIKHEVFAKASKFITFSFSDIVRKKNSDPDQNPSPPPPPNIKWTVPKIGLCLLDYGAVDR